MLKRKPTRIEVRATMTPAPQMRQALTHRACFVCQLKPDDREEYFAHKQAKAPESNADQKDKPSDKDARIGIVRPR